MAQASMHAAFFSLPFLFLGRDTGRKREGKTRVEKEEEGEIKVGRINRNKMGHTRPFPPPIVGV